ncbi:MAG TPA: hypothetical protein VFY63_02875 [Pseudorhizobium sp.]|nr:hypothetical protein [Pseudorhizobium sp.]
MSGHPSEEKASLPEEVRRQRLAHRAELTALIEALSQAGALDPRHYHASLMNEVERLSRAGEPDVAREVAELAARFAGGE